MKEVLRHGFGITLGYRRHYRRGSGGGLRGHTSSVADVVAAVRRGVVWRWMQLRRQAKRRPHRLWLTPLRRAAMKVSSASLRSPSRLTLSDGSTVGINAGDGEVDR
ncbi:hypothetical protein MTBSS4_440027 [Magnetospirillum sp. SS-4]|nr:hypothetical protein MTBSS4_440027 [Magnetospirillum sp. SS-4]